jgi:hypothetical protein
MEESKQNTWMARSRIALLREGSHLFCQEKEEKEEGQGSLGRSFLYHLDLGGRETLHHHLPPLTCGLRGGVLEPRGGAFTDYT